MNLHLILCICLSLAPVFGSNQAIYQESVPSYVSHFTVKGMTRQGKAVFLIPVYGAYAEQSFKLWQDPDLVLNNEGFDDSPPLWKKVREFNRHEKVWDRLYAARHDAKLPLGGMRFALVDETGNFLGEAGLIPASGDVQRHVIYYNVDKAYRGKGIASVAAKKLVETFKKYWPDLPLYIYFKVGNVGSEKVARRAGFRPHILPNGSPETRESEGKKFVFYKLTTC